MSTVMITRILVVLVCLVAGGTTGLYLKRVLSAPVASVHQLDPQVDLTISSPTLSPSDVVKRQIESIRRASTDPRHMVTCYSLSSPSNRASTGPLNRYAAMCFAKPYDAMSTGDDWQIGASQIEGDYASVVVSFNIDREVRAFGFFLQKQHASPFEDCWMTDSVIAFPSESIFANDPQPRHAESDVD